MAFPSAAGHGNLPNGNFSPVIYSKKVQKAFRRSSVIEDITNSDWMGEIANYGDSVRIIKEPSIEVKPYARGQQVTPQYLEDDDFTLVVDKSNFWAFLVDDIEEKHSHVNWESLATDQAAYRLRDEYDREVLGYMTGYVRSSGGTWSANTTVSGTKADETAGSDELLAASKLTRGDFGASSNEGYSVSIGTSGTYDASPLAVMNRMKRILDTRNTPDENRWFVADPVFYEILEDENSKLLDNDYAAGQDAGGILRNGLVTVGTIRGFRCYKSNNLPTFGTGPGTNASAGSDTNYGVVTAGHMSAVATASQLVKTETIRSDSTFGDIVRGMQLYGRKILRPEGLVRATYNIN